jgi:hypothetical protein
LFGEAKYYLRVEIDQTKVLQFNTPKENPVVVEYKNLKLE